MPETDAAAAVPVADLAAAETGVSGWVIEAQSIGSRLLDHGPLGEGPMGAWSTEGVPIGEGPTGESPAGEGKEAGTLVAVESMLRGDISRASVTLLACRNRCAQGCCLPDQIAWHMALSNARLAHYHGLCVHARHCIYPHICTLQVRPDHQHLLADFYHRKQVLGRMFHYSMITYSLGCGASCDSSDILS